MEIVGAILTHYHVDHCGGIPPQPYDQYGIRIDGLMKLVKKLNISAYIHPLDVGMVVKTNPEFPVDKIIETADGMEINLPFASLPTGPVKVRERSSFQNLGKMFGSKTFGLASSNFPSMAHKNDSKLGTDAGDVAFPNEKINIKFLHTPGHSPGMSFKTSIKLSDFWTYIAERSGD